MNDIINFNISATNTALDVKYRVLGDEKIMVYRIDIANPEFCSIKATNAKYLGGIRFISPILLLVFILRLFLLQTSRRVRNRLLSKRVIE